jgi:MFS transporter, SP family, sugar:H+ symporter
VIGVVVQIGALFAMAGIGTAAIVTTPMANGIVALLTIFGIGFSIGWAPLTYVVTTEIMSPRLRDITARFAFLVNVVTK